MRVTFIVAIFATLLLNTVITSHAASCRSGALGVSRTLRVNTEGGMRVGLMQYASTLALRPKEVVLTFDDGPIGGPTKRVLEALAAECVKATFFVVGTMARAYPEQLRAIYGAGHTIAAHSHSHPYKMARMNYTRARNDIDKGFADISAVLGSRGRVAPFFRYPGLSQTSRLNAYLASQNIGVFSADVVGDDWHRISSNEILRRVMRRLNQRGRGIILLHDIKNKTAKMLPALLRRLKKDGYKIVHIVPRRGSINLASNTTNLDTPAILER